MKSIDLVLQRVGNFVGIQDIKVTRLQQTQIHHVNFSQIQREGNIKINIYIYNCADQIYNEFILMWRENENIHKKTKQQQQK